MDSGIFFCCWRTGATSPGAPLPIIVDGVTDMSRYVNPIPAGLVLTGIVVSVSVSAVMLSLTVRIYKTYRTLDVDKLYMMISPQEKEEGPPMSFRTTFPLFTIILSLVCAVISFAANDRWPEV